jgi:hypothetical protein
MFVLYPSADISPQEINLFGGEDGMDNPLVGIYQNNSVATATPYLGSRTRKYKIICVHDFPIMSSCRICYAKQDIASFYLLSICIRENTDLCNANEFSLVSQYAVDTPAVSTSPHPLAARITDCSSLM